MNLKKDQRVTQLGNYPGFDSPPGAGKNNLKIRLLSTKLFGQSNPRKEVTTGTTPGKENGLCRGNCLSEFGD